MEDRKRRVLLGVTGCIAAYKSCEILRGFQKAGIDVQVVMTENAERFVGHTTFEALSGFSVGRRVFDDSCGAIPHITLAESCDLFLIAPCTANVLAKLANGIADDLLTSTALATTAPLVIAPAMNMHMYENLATQHNIETLRSRGIHVIDATSGHLACGDIGPGKLPEPDTIVEYVIDILKRNVGMRNGELIADRHSEGVAKNDASYVLYSSNENGILAGRKIVITSGPTVEPIDAVRYLSNYSSGKMGAALAEAALDAGADVVVISGPVSISYPSGCTVVSVKTAREMHDKALSAFKDADIVICAAAVADYRPEVVFSRKLKKGIDDNLLSQIRLVKNPDILKDLGEKKRKDQIIVGFAAETDNLLSNARGKRASKGADMIVANEVGQGKAFNQDTDKAVLVTSTSEEELPELSKHELAQVIIERISKLG